MKRVQKKLFCASLAAICISAFAFAGCEMGFDFGFGNGDPPEAKVYTVRYFDGEDFQSMEVTEGTPYSVPAVPEKTGYDFMGFYDAETGGAQYLNALGASLQPFSDGRDLTLYPQYRAKEYLVNLDYGGAEPASTLAVQITYGNPIAGLPLSVYDEDRVFKGWYTLPDCGGVQIASDRGMIQENAVLTEEVFDLSQGTTLSLYAGFEDIYYNVRFVIDGETQTVPVKSGTLLSAAAPQSTADGRTILEWAYNKNGAPLKDEKIQSEGTYHALTYEVALSLKTTPLVSETMRAKSGETVSLPVPEREFYSFEGWEYEGENIGTEFKTPTQNALLTAIWSKTREEYAYIETAEDFIKINENPSGKYLVTEDLDLSEVSRERIPVFRGELEGNGHTVDLKGKSHTYSLQTWKDANFGWFAEINEGTISDLTIKNLVYRSAQDFHEGTFRVHVGGLCGYNAAGAVIRNVKIVNDTSAESASSGAAQLKCDRNNSACGGIAGCNYGVIADCSVANTIYSTGDTGGVCGVSGGTIEKCTFRGKIGLYLANDNGNRRTRTWGGIVGYCDQNAVVRSCTVSDIVFQYYGENGIYHNTIIFGIHSNCGTAAGLSPYVGGICGLSEKISSFVDCAYTGPTRMEVLGGNFHYGDTEKVHLFRKMSGMVGWSNSDN